MNGEVAAATFAGTIALRARSAVSRRYMAMSEHDKIRELLALAAADALTSAEEKQVAEHVRSCIACSNELGDWRPIASELRRLPMPQPSSWLVQAPLARAEAKFTEQAEHDWNPPLMIIVVG